MSVAQVLRDAAAGNPAAVAIDGDGRRATYAELTAASNRIASNLVAAGIERGDRVGFVDRNGTEYWETFLGAMKAGAVLVPLNFRLSADELAWSFDDAGVGLIVAGAPYAHLVRPQQRPFVVIGAADTDRPDGALDYDAWVAGGEDLDPIRDAQGPELIELIYSSGTTGRPKGVLVSDEQLSWSTQVFGACFDVDHHSRSLVPIPYYHVAGGGWALITLTRGGQIIQSREPTAASMLRQLLDYRVTHTAMVPAVMQVLSQSPESRSADFSALRQVVYGGSPISEPLVRSSVETFGAQLFQSYGLSETMGVTTLLGPDQHRLDSDLSRLRSAGRAIPGVEIEIRDLITGKVVGVEETGEILVRAPSVTPGYWQRPEATAEAFTSDGFLHTGDVGSLDSEGFLFIRDRIKDMIVTGGENVYPAEVESVLAGAPGVLDVAVIGVPSPEWGETPMAFVVAAEGTVEAADVITFAREHLAHFKCPTSVTFLDELPRNPSGKVLKRELREPFWAGESRYVG